MGPSPESLFPVHRRSGPCHAPGRRRGSGYPRSSRETTRSKIARSIAELTTPLHEIQLLYAAEPRECSNSVWFWGPRILYSGAIFPSRHLLSQPKQPGELKFAPSHLSHARVGPTETHAKIDFLALAFTRASGTDAR